MGEEVTISREEYDDLRRAAALVRDIEAAEEQRAVAAHPADPQAEPPAWLLDRLLDDEPPWKVIRDWRGRTQNRLAEAPGVNRVQIAEIEMGSIAMLRKPANALRVTIDEPVPTAL